MKLEASFETTWALGPWRTIAPQKATINGKSIAYDDDGSGPTVVLIHGYGMCREMWRHQQDCLTSQGYRVISPDLCGFGQSEAGHGPFTIASCSDNLIGLLNYLGIGRAVICGFSMGGYVLLDMLHRHTGRIFGACLVATRCQADSIMVKRHRTQVAELLRNSDQMTWIDALIAPLLVGKSELETPEWLAQVRSWLAGTDRETLVEALLAMREMQDSALCLGRFHRPALVLGGERDRVVTPEQGRHLASSIPFGVWRMVPGAGHLISLERPHEFNAILLDFLHSLKR
jgi:3-oxoadipate enol-lactonase